MNLQSVYYPAPELMSQASGLSKLIATLIASPRFMAQKPITRLNVSAMACCVMRNGWLPLAHTQFRSQPCGTHAVFPGRLPAVALLLHLTLTYIYIYVIGYVLIYPIKLPIYLTLICNMFAQILSQ